VIASPVRRGQRRQEKIVSEPNSCVPSPTDYRPIKQTQLSFNGKNWEPLGELLGEDK
jgi:hypothetical protein